MFVSPGDRLYEGMVIGIHSRDNDLVVNPIKGKQLDQYTRIRNRRSRDPDAADSAHPGICHRIHR